jgi:hypothetical protein
MAVEGRTGPLFTQRAPFGPSTPDFIGNPVPVFAVNIDSRLEARRRHHVPLMNPELIRHMDKHSAASSGTATAIAPLAPEFSGISAIKWTTPCSSNSTCSR